MKMKGHKLLNVLNTRMHAFEQLLNLQRYRTFDCLEVCLREGNEWDIPLLNHTKDEI